MPSSTERAKGFTLLEMLVVLLIVSLISALLMQGFLYMAGVYGVVDRKQKALQSNQLSIGWLKDSVQGLVNGADGSAWKEYSAQPFTGSESGFEGLGLVALSTAGGVVTPLIVGWRFEGGSSDELSLVYSERRFGRADADHHVVRRWPRGVARISYLVGDQWHANFPVAQGQHDRLPGAIRVEVNSPRAPLYVIVRPGVSTGPYIAPRKESP